jgi:hypothetical protein
MGFLGLSAGLAPAQSLTANAPKVSSPEPTPQGPYLAQSSKKRRIAARRRRQRIRRYLAWKRQQRRQQYHWGSFVGFGVPHPLDFGVSLTQVKNVSHMVSGGFFSLPLPSGKFDQLQANMFHLEYKYRSIPWKRHPFYWGIGAGIQQLEIIGRRPVGFEHQESGTKIDIEIDAAMQVLSAYYTPHLGFVWYQRSGFHAGFSFGYVIPFYSDAAMDTQITNDSFVDDSVQSTENYQALKEDVETLGRKAGRQGLPFVQLIEMGYLF